MPSSEPYKLSLIHRHSDFFCYPREAVAACFYLLKWHVFIAQFCEEQVPCRVNISVIVKNFTDLKGRTGNVTLEIPFTEFVEVPDGDYFRQVSWHAS